MKKEIWKDIKGYKGMYQVSNLGQVKSLRRIKVKEDRILKPILGMRGYLSVNLSNEGKARTREVHQLMAIAFLNHIPNGNIMVVDHINNIPTDNILDNLQIISQRENLTKDRNNKTGYTGIRKCRKKYQARIIIKGELKNLGMFNNHKIANAVYLNELENYERTHNSSQS